MSGDVDLPRSGSPWPVFAQRLAALHALRDDTDPAIELLTVKELTAQARGRDNITAYLVREEMVVYAPSAEALDHDDLLAMLAAEDVVVLLDRGAATTARFLGGELDLRYEYVATEELSDPVLRLRAAVLSDSLAVVHWLFGNSWFGRGLDPTADEEDDEDEDE
jgi:hypothetical protein